MQAMSARIGDGRRGAARAVQRDDTRKDVVERLLALLHEAPSGGCDLVVFPELALTTFFPRWFVDDIAEFDHFYETAMPGPDDAAAVRRGARGSASASASATPSSPSRTPTAMRHRYNTQILVERDGSVVARYRKVHLPGHEEHEPDRPFQHAERYYFEPGPDGFGVWRAFGGLVGMMICNDRRWPESYRVMGLQGVELILCGYNTPIHYAPDPSQDILQGFHNALVMQSGAYQNGTWVVGVAKGGVEEGVDSLAQSMIVAPSGQIVAQALTDRRRAGRGAAATSTGAPRYTGHAVRLRPLPPPRDVHPDHRRSAAPPRRLVTLPSSERACRQRSGTRETISAATPFGSSRGTNVRAPATSTSEASGRR